MLESERPSEDVTAAVCLFRSLADPARLAIITHLAGGEHRVGELTAHLGLAQSTVSQHLACLRDCGLVAARSQGRASYYSLARPELLDLLQSAERLLEATGALVRLCPNYGQDTGSGTGEADALAVMAVSAPGPAVTLSAIAEGRQ
jgi:DNA-binding transcriptional ArsR family regulator